MVINPAGLVEPYHIFQTPAVLVVNLADAHERAGHQLRARWYWRRANRLRLKRLRVAESAALRGHWQRAYAYFDWAIIGIGDQIDIGARVLTQFTAVLSERGDAANNPHQEIPPHAAQFAAEVIRDAASRWDVSISEDVLL
jgi:hypothetical protein